MATLERPGVEVEQVVTSAAPTVLTPTLPACVVGPCYQIVSPLTSEGVLDPTAAVITPARIVGSTVAATLAANGLKLKVRVSGGSAQIITLPVSLSGNPLTQALIAQSINKQLTGASVEFVSNRLVITTNTSGDTASLYLDTPDSDSAYSVLGLSSVDLTLFRGKSKYNNLITQVPFANLPATKTAVSNLVFDEDNLSLYRYYANSLYALSDNSAVLHNSWANGAVDKLNGLAVNTGGSAGSVIGNYFQPLVSKRVSLVGKDIGSSKTNTVFHPGTHASLRFPLSYAVGDASNVNRWPDSSNRNYLYVEALGLQDYLSNSSATVRKYVGKAGNAVSVVLKAGNGASVSWDDGANQLTVQLDNGGVPAAATTTTFAELEALLTAGITNLAATPNIAVSLSYVDGTQKVYEGTVASLTGAGIVYYLSGGSDPVDFSLTVGAAANNQVATMTGTTLVEAGTTAGTLGIAGESITFAMNGYDPFTATFVSGTSVVSTIEAAFVAAFGNPDTVTINNVAVNAYARSITLTSPHGESSIDVLQIVANPLGSSGFYKEGQESTLQIVSYTSAKVIERLFTGALTKTVTGVSITPATNGTSSSNSLVIANYNPLAQSRMEKGIQPGAQSITLNNVRALGAIVFTPDTAAAAWDAGAAIKLIHGAGGAITIVPGAGSNSYSDYVTAMVAAIAGAPAVAGKISVATRTLGSGVTCLVIADATGTSTISVDTAGTHADIRAALLGAATNTLLDEVQSSVATTVTVADTGTGGDWVVTSVGNSLSNVLLSNQVTLSTAAQITTYLIDNTTSAIHYSGADDPGKMVVAFSKTAGNLPIAAIFSTSTADITWTQAWPHSFGPTKHDYTGRVFTGGCVKAYIGDSLYNGATPLGRIANIQNLSVGGTVYTGAQLVLTDLSVDKYGQLDSWFVRAEALDTYTPARAVEPEIVVDTTSELITIKHAVNRSAAGIAAAATAPLYAGYKALRLDVTAASANPSVLAFENVSEVDTLIGPISVDNPLAFGLSKAFEQTTDIQVFGLGVDDVTADAPEGTPEAYGRAFEVLELAEVYGIAPLTYNREVHRLLAIHCTNMSAASGKKERAGVCSTTMPVEKEPTLCISGNMTLVEGALGKYTLTFTDETKNVVSALDGKLDANGDAISAAPGATLTAEQGVFVDRAGDAYRYLVTEIISATEIQVEVDYAFDSGSGPGTGGNDDLYYKEDGSALADFPATGETCSVYVRQAAIDATTTTGKNEQVEAIAAYAGSFAMSRFMQIQPEQFGTLVSGTEVLVPSYYFCCAWVGATAQLNPAQGMTNLPLAGWTRPVGSNDKFTETQMATAAAGGVNWIIQDVAGGAVFSRHQLTTNIASLKTREWSVIKSVDYCAKTIRLAVARYIGRYNITKQLLEEISLTLTGVCSALSGTAVSEISISSIEVDSENPDHIIVEITLTPFFPANKIRVRLSI